VLTYYRENRSQEALCLDVKNNTTL
jgi:hypothetical protein